MTQEHEFDGFQQNAYSLKHYQNNPQDAKRGITEIYSIYINKIVEKQRYGFF